MLSTIDFKFGPIIHPQEKSVGMIFVLLPMETQCFLSNSPNNVCLKVHVDSMVTQLSQLITKTLIHGFFVQ